MNVNQPNIQPTKSCHKTNRQGRSERKILIDSIERIRCYYELNRTEMQERMCFFYKSILERYEWSIQKEEKILPKVKSALQSFAKNELSGIEELNQWIKQYPLNVLCNENLYSQNSQEFSKKTTLSLESTNVKFQNSEIIDYVKILIRKSRWGSSSIKIEPLLKYLSSTKFNQFELVIQTAIDHEGTLSSNFLTALLSCEIFLSHLNQKRIRGHSKLINGVNLLLSRTSHTFNSHFCDLIFVLLSRNEETQSLIKKILDSFSSVEFRYFRMKLLLKKLIDQRDQSQPQRIRNILRIIFGNKCLLSQFQQQSLNCEESLERVIFTHYVLKAHNWHGLTYDFKSKIGILIFNPIFYNLELFMHIADGEIQKQIQSLFLNLIKDEATDFKSIDCPESFKEISKLIKILVGLFNNKVMFEGRAEKFLEHILSHLLTVTAHKASAYQKLEIVGRILNSCLEVKIDHIGRLASKNTLEILHRKISNAFEGVQTFNELKERTIQFEKSFSHLLFSELYSDNDYKAWFRSENSQLNTEKAESILSAMKLKRKSIQQAYHEILKSNGFEYIHNNQIGAFAAIDTCIQEQNIFLKLGTGQGKSFIAEMSAIHLLNSEKPPERVFIFTSYNYLARRDYEDMKFLSRKSHFPTMYISQDTLFENSIEEIKKAKIFHIDSEHFHSFIAKSIGKLLDEQKNISDFVDIFLNQEKSAVMLDEGDLMIMDDPGNGRVSHFVNSFGNAAIEMSSQKEVFDEIIGPKFIQTLNENFPGCYDAWYLNECNNNRGETSSIHGASGKKTSFAGSFSHRVSKGIFRFSPLLFNFSVFARSFRDVLFLSGSIHEKNFEKFKNYFANEKENIFLNIPLFFGSHNQGRNLTEKRKEGNCCEVSWYSKIIEDIEAAIDLGQPILLFNSSEDELKMLKEKCREYAKIKSVEWITITEEEILEANKDRIGKRNTITFASAICGRGIDIKISKDIEKGLHVVITRLPDDYNERLLIQMIGRAGRLDSKGSFSIIVKEDIIKFEQIAENNRNKLIVSGKLKRNEKKLMLSKLILKRFERQYDKEVVKKWLLFLEMISDGYITLEENMFEKVKKFICEES